MKRMYLLILPVMFLLGCAFGSGSKPVDAAMNSSVQDNSFEKGLEYLQQGIEASQDGDREAARQAFSMASRHFFEEDTPGRLIMQDATVKLKKTVTISGFEYAPKKSFELLVVYLEMQNAYVERDVETLRNMAVLIDAAYQEVQQATVTEKQKRLEELGQKITQKSEEIHKQGQEDIFEVYPTIYVVKKGDTLPGITPDTVVWHSVAANETQRFARIISDTRIS